jgi:hypothetical protein
MTRDKGEWVSMRCANPASPFRPGLKGSSHTVLRPFKQSSITRTRNPASRSLFSRTPGQRSSNANRLRVLGIMPQVRESAYTRTLCINCGRQFSVFPDSESRTWLRSLAGESSALSAFRRRKVCRPVMPPLSTPPRTYTKLIAAPEGPVAQRLEQRTHNAPAPACHMWNQ